MNEWMDPVLYVCVKQNICDVWWTLVLLLPGTHSPPSIFLEGPLLPLSESVPSG